MPSPRGRSPQRAASRTAEVWSPCWHSALRPLCWARGFWPAKNRAPTRTISRWWCRRARRTPFGLSFWSRLAKCPAQNLADGIRAAMARPGGAWSRISPGRAGGRPDGDRRPMPVLRFMGFPPNSDARGDIDSMDLLAGQSVGLIRDVEPAGQIVGELAAEARQIISQRLSGLIATNARGG